MSRLLEAVADMMNYVRHDIDHERCAACPRWDELQQAALQSVKDRDILRREVDGLLSQLGDITEAIGTTEYMDPPDGGSASLAGQVEQMREEILLQRKALDEVRPLVLGANFSLSRYPNYHAATAATESSRAITEET
jgi:hypothetical protein